MNVRRISLRRSKGWRMPPNTVKIDRTTKWGNPFVIGTDGDRAQCIELYERFVTADAPTERADVLAARRVVQSSLAEIAGKNLACWCPQEGPCHGDILLRLANS